LLRLTDGRTDRRINRQTDRILIARLRLHSMHAVKISIDVPFLRACDCELIYLLIFFIVMSPLVDAILLVS